MTKDLVKFGCSSNSLLPDKDLTIEEYIEFIRQEEQEYRQGVNSSKQEIQQILVHHEHSWDYADLCLQAYRSHTEKELEALKKRRASDARRKKKEKEKIKELRLKQFKKLQKEFG